MKNTGQKLAMGDIDHYKKLHGYKFGGDKPKPVKPQSMGLMGTARRFLSRFKK